MTPLRWMPYPLLIACSDEPIDAYGVQVLDEAQLRADVEFLASPKLDGRYPGSAGDESARSLVESRFESAGLLPQWKLDSYQQPFVDDDGNDTANVLAILPGADNEVGHEIVVLSAHTDHLGDGYLGANDNASGVAALLSIAEIMAENPAPRRTVVFAAFGAEESGYEGSRHFLNHPPAELDPTDIVYNVNLDMIGTYDQTEIVWALGTLAGTPAKEMVKQLRGDYPSLDVGIAEPSDLSDNATFCEAGIPYVFFWTDDPDCYHKRCDTADRLDYSSMAEITALTLSLTAALAGTTEDLAAGVQPGMDVCGI